VETIDVAGLTLQRTPAAAVDKDTDKSAANGEARSASTASWQVEAAGQGEVVNPAGAQDLTGKLARLRIGAVLGTEAKPEYGLDKPALALSVTRKGGERLEYRLGPTGKEGYAVLKSSARPEYFRVPGNSAAALIKAAARAQLVQAAPVPAPVANAPAGQSERGKPGDSPAVDSNPGNPGPAATGRQATSQGGAS
jgi:hypothetical protein